MKVSILLLTIDRLQLTSKILSQNLSKNNTEGINYELLHCDNGSTDPSVIELVKTYNPVYQRLNKVNEGIPKAFNQLILRSTGDLIFLFANDILMPDGWLQSFIYYSKVVPNPGVIGFECTVAPNPLTYKDGVIAHYSRDGEPKDYSIYGPLGFTRDAIFDLGLICESMSIYGLCDSDLGLRMMKSGRQSFYIPFKKSIHLGTGEEDSGEYRAMKDKQLEIAYYNSRERFNNMSSENCIEKLPEIRENT